MARSNGDCLVWLTTYKRMDVPGDGEIPVLKMTILDVALLAAAEHHVSNRALWCHSVE
ncbi:hypothetical protein [Paenarthrobacter sp. AB444]|uniref:hypothetical protein n=1 Tax=Paenarthrobacter sp. AB444 TaxID=3025681 RepID=UPI002365BE25|nr:hypothetical protein [Paenarthrobacter sp. AB444]MDD7833832.1 hypothetical protein [Paenarthrobacter sp. AB444]